MAAGSLLALLDDIASVLDDVALMSKVAAKKTSGVLGDDLALNAQQVSGVRAERELPVVWAVTKGSLLNKLILVPAALIISAFLPEAIVWLLMIGGAYLCFEGVEKVVHKLFHKDNKEERRKAIAEPSVDMVEFEKDKIKGAIRTDFILSAEIIVISLGTMASAALPTQIIALSALALLFTFGVYGLVAAIVKLDDAGLWLVENANGGMAAIKRLLGRFLLGLAPRLMKWLAFIGTVAMFMVGGGIIVHHIPELASYSHDVVYNADNLLGGGIVPPALGIGIDIACGFAVGLALVVMHTIYAKIRGH
jgi:predicted DNA repair protein MutK